MLYVVHAFRKVLYLKIDLIVTQKKVLVPNKTFKVVWTDVIHSTKFENRLGLWFVKYTVNTEK